jgi:predicted small secreted protein
MNTIFLASAAALVCALSFSCNTTIGVGRDMRILGENMEHAANKKRSSGLLISESAPECEGADQGGNAVGQPCGGCHLPSFLVSGDPGDCITEKIRHTHPEE